MLTELTTSQTCHSVPRFKEMAPVFSGLDDRLARASIRRVDAKELVFGEGDPATHLFRIESGVVCLFKVSSDGRRQVLGFGFPGDFVGLGALEEHVINAQAITACRLKCLQASMVREMARHDPELGLRLYEAVAQELAAVRGLLMTTGQRSAGERVASFLISLSERNKRNGIDPRSLELAMTRSDIADFLGLTIETVSRTLTKFKLMNLIGLPQRSRARILDLDGLKLIAEGVTTV